MRTAADFNQFYAAPDPWRISRARFRDRMLRRCVSPFIAGKSLLELGCGEGHLTQAVFNTAKNITGIDLSQVAIQRAKALDLSNATFASADFLGVSFAGYDIIAAIECLYYLTPEDQETFFAKIVKEHHSILIISGPIIRGKYFTHVALMNRLRQLGEVEWHNLNVYRRNVVATLAAVLVRLPFGGRLLDLLPEKLIYQRCYIIRIM
jgi:2-polyprenyl-3-methyl-5-hydroxy-6-metoxy-1,4-benzoquinol methylase